MEMEMEMNKLAVAISGVSGNGKIFAFVSGKGGVLKSTNSQNLGVALAHQNYKVLILDFDPQKTTKHWDAIRQLVMDKQKAKLELKLSELKKTEAENGYKNPIVTKHLYNKATELRKMKNLKVMDVNPSSVNWSEIEALKSEYDFIICDTSGHLELIGTTKDIIKHSDMVFVPFNNSLDDFNVKLDVKRTIDSCGEIKAKVFSLVIDLNEKQGKKGFAEKMLNSVANVMPIAPVKLYKRASWLEVKFEGKGVIEGKKDKVAVAQFKNFATFVINEMNIAANAA